MKSKPDFQQFSRTIRDITSKTESAIGHEVIIKKADGYRAYSEYDIVQVDEMWHVRTPFRDPLKFYTTKSALGWCLAHKAGRWELAQFIHFLDNRLAAKQNDIEILTHRIKNCMGDEETRAIMQCRLSEDIHNRQTCKQQLSKCLETAKYIKIKGLPNL